MKKKTPKKTKKVARVRKPARKLVNPMAVVPDKLYNKALDAVNRIREAAGLVTVSELPSGTPGEAKYCPLAIALADAGVTEVNAGEGVKVKTERTETVKRLGRYVTKTKTEIESLFPHDEDLSKQERADLNVFEEFTTVFDDKGALALEVTTMDKVENRYIPSSWSSSYDRDEDE